MRPVHKKCIIAIPFSFLEILPRKATPIRQREREKQGHLKPVGTMYLSRSAFGFSGNQTQF